MEGILEVALGKALLAALLAVVAVASAFLRAPTALRHLLWLTVLLSFLSPPVLRVPLALSPLGDQGPAGEPVASPALAVPAPEIGARVPVPTATNEADIARPAAGVFRGSPSGFGWPAAGKALLASWLLGSLFVLAVALRRIRLCRHLITETMPAPEAVQEEVLGLARRWRLERPPRVRFTERCAPPFLWALGRAQIVVSRILWEGLDDVQRRTLLTHELAHFARRDHWTRWLELCVEILYWWHPAVWVARRELRTAEEELADAHVIGAHPGSARSYGETLLRSLDLVAGDVRWRPVAGSTFGLRSLTRRLRLLRDGMVAKPLSGRSKAMFLALAIPCLALGVRFGSTETRALSEPSSAEGGSYPHALPAWYEELSTKLSTPVDFRIAEPAPLADALSAAAKIVDLKVELRDGAPKRAERVVELTAVQDLPLQQVLDLLTENAAAELRLTLVPGTVVITDTPEKYPLPKAVPVRRRIEAVRRHHSEEARDERKKAAERQKELERLLKRSRLHLTDEADLNEILDVLKSLTGVSFLVHPDVAQPRRATLRVQDASFENALEKLLSPLELSWIFKEGCILVLPEADAAKARRRSLFEERKRVRLAERLEKLAKTRLPPGLSEKRPRDIVQPLQKALGFPVYPDPAVWEVSRRIRLSGRDPTVHDLVSSMRRVGVRMLIEGDGIFLLAEKS